MDTPPGSEMSARRSSAGTSPTMSSNGPTWRSRSTGTSVRSPWARRPVSDRRVRAIRRRSPARSERESARQGPAPSTRRPRGPPSTDPGIRGRAATCRSSLGGRSRSSPAASSPMFQALTAWPSASSSPNQPGPANCSPPVSCQASSHRRRVGRAARSGRRRAARPGPSGTARWTGPSNATAPPCPSRTRRRPCWSCSSRDCSGRARRSCSCAALSTQQALSRSAPGC